jgi:superoxide reductase
MTMSGEFYRCEVCGNMVNLLHAGAGTMECCAQPMTKIEANTTDAAAEKHVPVVEKGDKTIKVSVGSVAHPMEDAHYIEWIELVIGDKSYWKHLEPGDAPEVEFCVCDEGETGAYAYCNQHGLWRS